MFEAVHGTAPDIAGQGIANPIGMILSVGLMFEHTFERADLRKRLDEAVSDTLDAGFMTPDIGGHKTSAQVTDAILERLAG